MRHRIQLACGMSVVDQDDESTRHRLHGGSRPLDGAQIDLGAPAGFECDVFAFEIFVEAWRRNRPFDRREPMGTHVYVDLAETLAAHHQLMDGERVKQLVGDQDAGETGWKIGGRRRESVLQIAERFALGSSGFRADLDQMKPDAIVERRMAASDRAQDVSRQPSVARSGFDEIELVARGSWLEQASHLGDLSREQLAEERADVDAGKKIARTARTL